MPFRPESVTRAAPPRAKIINKTEKGERDNFTQLPLKLKAQLCSFWGEEIKEFKCTLNPSNFNSLKLPKSVSKKTQ